MIKVWDLIKLLFPLNRSITGTGNLETLNIIKRLILPNLKFRKVKSGSKVFDWVVPPEWNVKKAYIKNRFGEKIIDFSKNNLHLVSYSVPFKGKVKKKKLLEHLYFLDNYPNWIPYRTSYYDKKWGFCCKKNLINSKKFKGPFEVFIDSRFKNDGNLIWGEAIKKGKSKKEILISTYFCHPSLANDNLSGLVTSLYLFYYLNSIKTKYSYRLLILPETIGSISFLRKKKTKNIIGGMILTCTGGPDKFSLKESFDEKDWINQLAHKALKKYTKNNYKTYTFTPDGSDERQYSSPAFRISTPSIHKSKYYEYKEYHTSADNLNFISENSIIESIELYKLWIKHIERHKFNNRNVKSKKKKIFKHKHLKNFCIPKRKQMACEFQLGKRGLYPQTGGSINQPSNYKNINSSKKRIFKLSDKIEVLGYHLDAFNWLMHLADGTNSNYEISEKSGIDIKIINEAIILFYQKKLIKLI